MATKTEIPVDVPVKRVPLSADQQEWLEMAVSLIDEERMRAFNCAITNIHSPTGEEREINEWMVRHMHELVPGCPLPTPG